MSESNIWAPLSDTFITSRNHLHQIAFFAISPARYRELGRMGLAPTTDGFGTPEFNGMVARVEGTLLVFESGGTVAIQEISTIRAAAEFFAESYQPVWFEDFHDPLPPMDPDSVLSVAPGDTSLMGEWFRFGFDVLEALRESSVAADDGSQTQIWPEHFDAAAEFGSSEQGRRASYGASPGDVNVAEPYLYVAPWSGFDKADSYWNATSFGGSILTHSELIDTGDPAKAAYDFYAAGYERLHS